MVKQNVEGGTAERRLAPKFMKSDQNKTIKSRCGSAKSFRQIHLEKKQANIKGVIKLASMARMICMLVWFALL